MSAEVLPKERKERDKASHVEKARRGFAPGWYKEQRGKDCVKGHFVAEAPDDPDDYVGMKRKLGEGAEVKPPSLMEQVQISKLTALQDMALDQHSHCQRKRHRRKRGQQVRRINAPNACQRKF